MGLPKDWRILVNLGKAYYWIGDKQNSVGALRRAQECVPKSQWEMVAKAYRERGVTR